MKPRPSEGADLLSYCEGDLCVCFCVTAIPVKFLLWFSALNLAAWIKRGLEQLAQGDEVPSTITVTKSMAAALLKKSLLLINDPMDSNTPAEIKH